MHLDDEALRTLLDRPEKASAAPERSEAHIQDHLNACPDCRARFAALQARAARVEARMALLVPGAQESPRPAAVAWAQFAARQQAASRKDPVGMLQSIFSRRFRLLWIGLSIIVLSTVAFSFEPVRVWAGDLLALFRVQRITVLPVDTTHLTDIGLGTEVGKQVAQMVSDSVDVTKKPGPARVVASAAEAGRLAGFTVRMPASRTDTPQIAVQDGTSFQFVVNRARAQAILNEAGRPDLQLPAALDKATVKVVIPTGVAVGYGDCPKVGTGAEESNMNSRGSMGRRYANCVMLVEIPSPTVDTPPDVSLSGLAEIALQFTGMTAQQAHDYSQTVDWTSTLVVPIPRNGSTYKQVQVDGVTGYLIQRPVDDAPSYALIWVKDGILYAIGGLSGDTAGALAMGESLR